MHFYIEEELKNIILLIKDKQTYLIRNQSMIFFLNEINEEN